jgi:NAD+ kinase
VIPDSSKIEIRIADPEQQFIATQDSRRSVFFGKQTFFIEKAPFFIHTVRLRNQHFFDTIRGKLMWGLHGRVIAFSSFFNFLLGLIYG